MIDWTRKQQEQIRDAWDAFDAVAYETDTTGPTEVRDALRDEKRCTSTIHDARRLCISAAHDGAEATLGNRDPARPADLYGMRRGLIIAHIAGAGLARKNPEKMREWIREHAEPALAMASRVTNEHFANL